MNGTASAVPLAGSFSSSSSSFSYSASSSSKATVEVDSAGDTTASVNADAAEHHGNFMREVHQRHAGATVKSSAWATRGFCPLCGGTLRLNYPDQTGTTWIA